MAKTEPERTFPIQYAKVQRWPETTMILREEVGHGTIGDEEFDISYNVGSGEPVWYFHKEGRYYTVSLADLTKDVMAARVEAGAMSKEALEEVLKP